MQDKADNGQICCRFCTTEFDREERKNKHEIECVAGPRLSIKITVDERADLHLSEKIKTKCDVSKKTDYTHMQGSSGAAIRKSRTKADRDTHSETKYLCDKCSYETNHTYSFNRHKIAHEKRNSNIAENSYSCNICDYKTWLKSRLKRHSETHIKIGENEQRVYSCKICDYKTKRKCSLKVHSIRHNKHKLQPYICHNCGYQTYRKDVLRSHIRRHSETLRNSYKCTLCEKVLLSPQSLEEHLLRMHPKSSSLVYGIVHRCPSCPFKSKSTSAMKVHMLSHSGPPHECKICGHLEYTKHMYRRHLVGHSRKVQDLKKIQVLNICRECGKECIFKYKLDDHIVRQHGDNGELLKTVNRVIKCCEVCSYKTTNNTFIAKHRKSHNKM